MKEPASETMILTPEDQLIRYEIMQHFITKGAAPRVEEMSEKWGKSVEEINTAFERLQENHALVLAPGTSNIWMIHPFSAVPTHHIVHTKERAYWANCGWDLLGVPVVTVIDSTIHVSCEHCEEKIEIEIRDGEIVKGDAVVHFTVPARRFWDNVGYT